MQTFTRAYNERIKQNNGASSGRVVFKPEIKPRRFSVSLRWAYNFLSQSLTV